MRKLFLYPFVLFTALCVALPSVAQKQIRKKDLKATKLAEKDAKKRQKEGWYTAVGSIPMAKVFEQAWAYELELREDGEPRYIMATGSATSGTKAAADQAALTAARNELASTLGAKISELIQTKRATDQIDQATANTLDKTISNSKTLIQAELTGVKIAYKIYKDVEDKVGKRKNIMVETKIFYNQEEAMRVAQRVIRRELEKDADALGYQLEDVLGINKNRNPDQTNTNTNTNNNNSNNNANINYNNNNNDNNNNSNANINYNSNSNGSNLSINVNVNRTSERKEESYTNYNTTTTTTTGNCSQALNTADFSNIKEEIKDESFENGKLKTAKRLTQSVCLSKSQIKDIAQIFAFENTKLEYLKFAYDFCYDKQDYYQLGSVLVFGKTKDELNDFLKDK